MKSVRTFKRVRSTAAPLATSNPDATPGRVLEPNAAAMMPPSTWGSRRAQSDVPVVTHVADSNVTKGK